MKIKVADILADGPADIVRNIRGEKMRIFITAQIENVNINVAAEEMLRSDAVVESVLSAWVDKNGYISLEAISQDDGTFVMNVLPNP